MRDAACTGSGADGARPDASVRPDRLVRGRPGARPTRAAVVAVAAAVCLVLSGCVAPAPDRSALPSSPPGTATATTPPAAAPTPPGPPAVLLPSGGVEVVAQGLQAPWSILRLPTAGCS